MERHEWFEQSEVGKVYYRANYRNHGRWTIMTAVQKRNPTWVDLDPVPEEIWRKVRELVFNKYQRKRLPWERVAEIDKMLGEETEKP
ncbi:MAG: hypothetical protein ACO3SO_01720 [Luteolibacter sp.]